MIDTKFKKPIREVTDEEWQEIYDYRILHGKYPGPRVTNGEGVKSSHLYWLNRKEQVKRYLEKTVSPEVYFYDTHYDYVDLCVRTEYNVPDLVVWHGDERQTYVVKMYHHTDSEKLKMRFKLYLTGTESEAEMLDKIWKYDFHDADVVALVTPEDDICYITKESLRMPALAKDRVPAGQKGLTDISFYVTRGEWGHLE